MKKLDYSTFLSPFTWRYGSEEMRQIWSEENKRKLWRKIWVALASAQHKQGLVSKEELDDLIKHQNEIDVEKAHEIEAEVQHDLMAEAKVYTAQAKVGGGKIHLGATSMDIEDNTDFIRAKESLEIIEKKLKALLKEFAAKIEEQKDNVCMGYTHLQPAEPTTIGYRLSLYAQDLLNDLFLIERVKPLLKGKGIKGAIGTSASYVKLLDEQKAEVLEKDIIKELGIEAADITGQTAPRKFDFFVSMILSSIAQSIHKFAFDVRIMQSPGFSEWQEPFGQKQIGSSAMPFKKNPWKCEQMTSLARFVMHTSTLAGDNAAHMLLERTLDDSPNRRTYIPETFLAIDEMLTTATKVIKGLLIHQKQVENNLEKFGPFCSTEGVMMETVKRGANRQEMHEILRELSMEAWNAIQKGEKNPLVQLMKHDKRITKYLKPGEVEKLNDPKEHVGLAPKRCRDFLKKLNSELNSKS